MNNVGLYDSAKMDKQVKTQRKKAWKLTDLDFSEGIDLKKPFLSFKDDNKLMRNLSKKERLVLNQFLGLVVNSTISELENILQEMKKECYDDVIDKYPVSPEMESLGEEFFKEEEKHSKAFDKYLNQFAKQTNVDIEELKEILPKTDQKYIKQILRVNSQLGGNALWWIVAAVEEESILIYKSLKNKKIESNFKKLHQLHFEEEVRHANFAFLMLELYHRRVKMPLGINKKLNFLCGELLQISWSLSQLIKSSRVDELKNQHEFYKILSGVLPKLYDRLPLELINTLFYDMPYIMLILNPASNKGISDFIDKYGEFKIPRPKVDLEEAHE